MSAPTAEPVVIERPSAPVMPAFATFDDFLAWAMKAEVRAEWVAGETTLMTPVSTDHQRLLAFLHELFQLTIRPHGLGEVFFAPVALKLASRPSGREPDLIYVAAAHSERVQPTYIEGPADLVVEIVSPDSDARDRGDKFVEYEAAGIPEYWLIDPLRQAATFYQLDRDGRYRAAEVRDGIYRSAVVPGLWLRPGWLWQRPLPPVATALAEARG